MLGKILILVLGIFVIVHGASVDIQLPKSLCNESTDFITYMKKLPDCTSESFFTRLTNGLIYSSVSYYDLTISMLVATPDLNIFLPSYQNVLQLIQSLYKLLFSCLGLYFILGATSAQGKAQAKEWLKNVFIMICFISFSFVIFKLLTNLNTQLTTSFYATVDKNIFDIKMQASDLIYALVFSIYLFASVILTFFTLMTRYMLIPFALFLLPFGFFFYFIPPLKKIGSFLFTLIIPIIFMTTIDALFLSADSLLLSSADPIFSNPQMKAIGVISAIALIGWINLAVYIALLLSTINQATKVVMPAVSPIIQVAKAVIGVV